MQNTILTGDVLTKAQTLPENFFQAIIADPPYYNVQEEESWDTQWELPRDYVAWMHEWVTECMRTLKQNGLFFIFGQVGKREHVFLHVMSKLTMTYGFHDLVIWDRVVGYNDRGDSFTPQYEMVLVLRKSETPKFNKGAVRVPYDAATIARYMKDKRYKNLDARRAHLESGKFSTNIVSIPSLKGCNNEKVGHPTQKPLALIERLVLCSTDAGDTVLDPFLGSGTTAVACKTHGRSYVGIEDSEEYVLMAEKRLATYA